ncbi:MAG: hypothetical protein M5T61_20440 [Acidimicrobiia bacterium]|nr:hypothetical protein [Acidimicrobiia bacterium]
MTGADDQIREQRASIGVEEPVQTSADAVVVEELELVRFEPEQLGTQPSAHSPRP